MSEVVFSNINTSNIETPDAGTGTVFLDAYNKLIFKDSNGNLSVINAVYFCDNEIDLPSENVYNNILYVVRYPNFKLFIWDDVENVWVTITGSGVSNFTQLIDVPNSYINNAGKVLAVNISENGLEFVDIGFGVSGYSGFSGYSGVDGSEGQSGFSGYSGVNGSEGQSGFSGYSGVDGSSYIDDNLTSSLTRTYSIDKILDEIDNSIEQHELDYDHDNIHIQNTDYKLSDYDQTIDITGATSIDFLNGAKAITAGKNKVILTSDNATETFTITDFPTYLVELRPKSGLLINILPSSTFQTQLGMIVSLNGDINDFIIIKKNS